ncbi:MAG: BlaI/MecI/CopY family transcriptional regulator [Planctomycetota bacterium]|jgi:predicted transcriptional regulator
MTEQLHSTLSRRERQIMDIIYRSGQASASDVLENLPDPPSYSSVRATLRILEEKGHVRHEKDGPRYVYLPIVSRRRARRSALRQLVNTFFDGSVEQVVAALLNAPEPDLTDEELDRLARIIEEVRSEGR